MTKTAQFSLGDPALDLLAYWRDCRGGDRLPHRRHIAPEKLRAWVGDLSVVHIHEGDKRFYIALHGANVARHVGPGFNKMYLEDAVPAASLSFSLAPYLACMERRVPIYSTMQPTLTNGLLSSLTRLVFPFCDADPEGVSRFIVRVEPNDRSQSTDSMAYSYDWAEGDAKKSLTLFPIDDDYSGGELPLNTRIEPLADPEEPPKKPIRPRKRFWPGFLGALERG